MTEIRWRKSSRSGGSGTACVELAHTLNHVRDSKNPEGQPLSVNVPALLASIRSGQFAR